MIVVCTIAFVAGCSHSTESTGSSAHAAIPNTVTAASPQLLMTSASSGYAVWPSGSAWVLLHTASAWTAVDNATPVAVPTGGGLVLAAAADELAVGVEPFDKLTTSPLLTTNDAGHTWNPLELPGPLSTSRHSVSIRPSVVTAVITANNGTLVQQSLMKSGYSGWTMSITGSQLAPSGRLDIDSIVWADGRRGWLTGHGSAGTPLAFTTIDGGHSWSAIDAVGLKAVTVGAPCGSTQSWQLPVLDADGSVRVLHSGDGGLTWKTGAALTSSAGMPAWGCNGNTVWMLAARSGSLHSYSSADNGNSWQDHGAAPAGITDLQPTGNDAGFATGVTSKGPVLWTVINDGSVFTPRALPSWVATLGGTSGAS
jgi:hypothetical protein